MLTVTNVHKHYPKTVETPRGRLNQKKAGIMSTKSAPEPLLEADEADVKQCFNKKERDVYIKVWVQDILLTSDKPVLYGRGPQLYQYSTDRAPSLLSLQMLTA